MDPTENLVFIVFCFFGFWLSIIPLYWHLQGKLQFTNGPSLNIKVHFTAWNTGTCVYMLWTSIGCLICFINAILWRGNVIDKAPIYCDIGKADAYFPYIR
jgi:pheromone a factor receptor